MTKMPGSRQDLYLRSQLVLPRMAQGKVLNIDLPGRLTIKLHKCKAYFVK